MAGRIARGFGAACFGAAVLVSPLVAAAQAPRSGHAPVTEVRPAHVPSDIVVTEAHIFLIKFVLQLRPEQEWHWMPVEAALRDLARTQAAAKTQLISTASEVNRASDNLDVAARLRRIALLARPLLRSLDVGQRQKLMTLARSARLEHLLVASQ
jgi:hypothetical protein